MPLLYAFAVDRLMGFGLSQPIPAAAIRGDDQYLIVGVLDEVTVIVIDQDGDMRPVTMQDIRTKLFYLEQLGVWQSTQAELEPEAESGSGSEVEDGPDS